MYLMPVNCTLENGQNGILRCVYSTTALKIRGLPWWFSGWDCALPRQRGMCSNPGRGTKIPHAAGVQPKIIKKIYFFSF